MRCTTAAAGPDAIRKCEVFFYKSTHMACLTGRIPLIDFSKGLIPFDARYPCIYTITHSIYGRWKAIESAYDWYMDYWDIVAGLRNDLKGRRSISRTLIVDVPQPLVEPEKALQKKCYGIAINQKEKTIELTEDADALAMFRPAVKGLRAFRHR